MKQENPQRYEAEVTLKDGQKVATAGSLNDCTAFVHDYGNLVKKVRIKSVQ